MCQQRKAQAPCSAPTGIIRTGIEGAFHLQSLFGRRAKRKNFQSEKNKTL
jgi:hypothetical protein